MRKLIRNIASDIQTTIQNVNTEMDLVYEALEQPWKSMAFENNGTISRLMDFLWFCKGATTSTTQSVTLASFRVSSVTLSVSSYGSDYTETRTLTEIKLDHSSSTIITSSTESYISDEASSSVEVDSLNLNVDDVVVTSLVGQSHEEEMNILSWLNITNLEQCDVAERQFKNYFNDVIIAPYGHINHYPEFFKFADLFFRQKSEQIYYNDCFALINKGKESLDYFWTVLDLINNFTQGNLATMKNLTPPVKIFKFPKTVDNFDARLRQIRGWREYFPNPQTQWAGYSIQTALTALADASKTIQEWEDSYHETIWYNPFPTENIEQYLDKDITKQELAKQFLSVQNVTEREKYFQAIKDTNSLMQTYQQKMGDVVLDIQLLHHLREVFDDNILRRLRCRNWRRFSRWVQKTDFSSMNYGKSWKKI